MIQYIYFVKCPNCEDEHFDFFDEAKKFALGCLSNKPIITQVEVCCNDFGECTDSCDLGTIWSWEEESNVTDDEPVVSVFTSGDLAEYNPDNDPEFDALDNSLDFEPTLNTDDTAFHSDTALDRAPDNFRKPIPEGMTIEQLVEEMEENEDTVECTWCEELFDKSECRYEVDLGWLCDRCQAAIMSRGETLTFRENNYWDFLDEDCNLKETLYGSGETVDLYYDELCITLSRQIDVDDFDEVEHFDSYTYTVQKDDVVEYLENNCMTNEDVASLPGGFDALEDEETHNKFFEANFDSLFEKYEDKILDYYKEDAAKEFSENYSFSDYEYDRECDYADFAFDSYNELL